MSSPTHVYFVKPVGMAGPIKIGCSWHAVERLKTLSTWSPFPLEIIVTIPGSYKLEKNIHACFADLHSHREWFHAADRLLAAIELLKQGVPVERAIDLNKRVGKITKGRCGGASWDEKTRQKMSVIHRVRFALKRIGVDNYRLVPPHYVPLLMRRNRDYSPQKKLHSLMRSYPIQNLLEKNAKRLS